MEALNAYDTDSGEEENESKEIKASPASALMEKLRQGPLNSAPPVPVRVSAAIFSLPFTYTDPHIQETQASVLRMDPTSKVVMYNPTAEQMYAPEVSVYLLHCSKCNE